MGQECTKRSLMVQLTPRFIRQSFYEHAIQSYLQNEEKLLSSALHLEHNRISINIC